MELSVCFVALCIVAVLAVRFGADSRTPSPSKEQDLADLGITCPASASVESNILCSLNSGTRLFLPDSREAAVCADAARESEQLAVN